MPPPRHKLNPAFAAAHGLAAAPPPGSAGAGVDAALRTARSTGRLSLAGRSLRSVPDAAFDLRSGVRTDLSLDSESNPGAWECLGEEDLTAVDVSDNDLGAGGREGLDARVGRFRSVRTLRARRCGLGSAPWPELGGLESLLVLDLSGNGLKFAPLECLPMTVREVDLSNNCLTRLRLEERPASGTGGTEAAGAGGAAGVEDPVIVLSALISLDVTDNDLVELPASMEAPSLQKLRFARNRIGTLPEALVHQAAGSLAVLEGADNRLESAPDLVPCRSLRIVDLGGNRLKDPPSVHPSLVRLSLADNAIGSLGGLFAGAQRGEEGFRSDLTELRVRGNRLAELDGDVARCLASLRLLDASLNDLRDLPPCLGYLPDLRTLALEGNALRAVRTSLLSDTAALREFLRKRGPPPPGGGYSAAAPQPSSGGSVGGLPSDDFARGLVRDALGEGNGTLDVAGRGLKSMPENLRSELANVGGRIRKLVVSNNSLVGLDGWAEALPYLKSIEGSRNGITALPVGLSGLPLSALVLPQNGLSSSVIASGPLCSGPSRLTSSLTVIDLSANKLNWFPSGLCPLPALSYLNLSNNNIYTLVANDCEGSGWVPGLPSLETLDLSSNRIANLGTLPISLAGNSPMLRTLLLHNNELASIPPTLGHLTGLSRIDLRGNPQRGVRAAILDRKCSDVIEYLRSRMDETELIRSIAAAESPVPTVPAAPELETAPASGSDADTKTMAEPMSVPAPSVVSDLKHKIEDVTLSLNNVHLTQAKKYALKKQLAMHKAGLIKEERRLRRQLS